MRSVKGAIMQRRTERGFTLVEVVVAAVLSALIAGGGLMAFVTALRMAQRGGALAAFYRTTMLNRYHNLSSCLNAGWFAPGTCGENLPTDAQAINFSDDDMQEVGQYRVSAVLPPSGELDRANDGILLTATVDLPLSL